MRGTWRATSKVSRNWVYQQADAGRLPSVRIGGVRRFDPVKIRALAESGSC